MAFPIPHFEDLDEQQPTSESIGSGSSIEFPFSLNRQHNFSFPTKNNLLYDDEKPLYKTPSGSCTLFVAQSAQKKSKFYALKVSRFVKRIRSEYDNYKAIGPSSTIIECYDSWVQGGKGFLQLELAKNGSIKNNQKNFSIDQIWKITAHVSSALSKVHKCGYMHLDVSPANILHTEDPTHGSIFKLSDFGTLRKVGAFQEDDEGAGPYVSPEALSFPHSVHKVTEKTDIFSFGIVLYELITRRNVPREYPGYEQLRNGTFKFQELPNEFLFVIDMMNFNPNERPSADDILGIRRCREEIDRLSETSNEMRSPVSHPTREVKTPELTTVKVAPETPYSKKYPGRRLFLDDDDFSNSADI